jgi:hypothetical protein
MRMMRVSVYSGLLSGTWEAGGGGAPGEFFGEAALVFVQVVAVEAAFLALVDEGAVAGGEARVAVVEAVLRAS